MARYIAGGGKTIIDSPQKLITLLNLGTKGFITELAKNTAKRLKTNTANLVYRAYKPKTYERTLEFLNSIVGPGYNGGEPTENIGNGFRATVKFDINKMSVIPPQNGMWGKHSGTFGSDAGTDAREAIISGFEEDGFEIISKKGIVYEREAVHMVEITTEEIQAALDGMDKEIDDFEAFIGKINLRIQK